METQQAPALRYIRMKETCRKIGLSKSAIYDRINAGAFPAPVRLGGRAVAFVESEVDAWMRAILAANRPQAQLTEGGK